MALLNQLPPELLALIFSWSLSQPRKSSDKPTRIAQEIERLQLVCHYWNDVAVSTPELWARVISSSRFHSAKSLRTLMDRSGSLPISLFVPLRRPVVQPGSAVPLVDHETEEVKTLLAQNAYRIHDVDFSRKYGYAILWPLGTMWSALSTLSIHFTGLTLPPLGPIPNLRSLIIEGFIHSDDDIMLVRQLMLSDSKQDIWAEVNLSSLELLEIGDLGHATVLSFINRCSTLTSLTLVELESEDEEREHIQIAPRLQRLTTVNCAEWVMPFARSSTATLIHLKMSEATKHDILPYRPFPILPALCTLQMNYSGEVESLVNLLNNASSLQAFDLHPRVKALSPLLARLTIALSSKALRTHDQLDSSGRAVMLFVPRLRFLRLRFGLRWWDRDRSMPGDDVLMRLHQTVVTHLIDLLKIRPALKVEVLFLDSIAQTRRDELQVAYAPCTSEFSDRIVVRTSVDSDLADLADSYEIIEDGAEGGDGRRRS